MQVYKLSKLLLTPQGNNPPTVTKEHHVKDTNNYHYRVENHLKRNCPAHLAELMKNKASLSSISGIFTIELHNFSTELTLAVMRRIKGEIES